MHTHWFATSLVVAALVLLAGCASKGLLERDVYDDAIHLPESVPDSLDAHDFLIIGDTQSSWRAEVKFYRRKNWVTWKQLLVPFYQVYLLGNGILGGVNWYRQKPDYGGRARLAVRQALQEEIDASPPPSFLLHLGDIGAHDGRYPDHWDIFLDEYGRGSPSILEQLPMAPAIGNHEYASDSTYGWPNFRHVFDAPRFYVIDTPEMAIFVLDSNLLLDQHQFLDDAVQDRLFRTWFVDDSVADGSPQAAWLQRELEARKDRSIKIVAMHHPIVSFGWHNRDWYRGSLGTDLLEKRDALLRLFRDQGVQAVLSGHEHLYEHSTIRLADEMDSTDAFVLHQIVSSGAGAAVRPPTAPEDVRQRTEKYRSEGLSVTLETQVSTYHYTRARIRRDSLILETRAVDVHDPSETTPIDRVGIGPIPSHISPTAPDEDQPER
ncbi:MAG: metallophosphoesterase [Rhodothermales bacterium]